MPLPRGSGQESGAEENRKYPPKTESSCVARMELFSSEVYRDTARKQADGEKNRRREHVLRLRPAETFSNVEKVRDNEDRENRRLGNNEAIHPDRTAIGSTPGELGPGCG